MNYSSAKKIVIILSFIFITGCAHNIQINPDLNQLRNINVDADRKINAAYFISKEKRDLQITSPGGGGDKVTYKPYAETEAALNTILQKVYNKVYSLQNINNKDYVNEKDISFIFIPEMVTNSSSDSLLTWPPTRFDIELSAKALNAEGEMIWEKTIRSVGNAEFDEFKSDFSLAARRSSEEAYKKLLVEIENSELLNP